MARPHKQTADYFPHYAGHGKTMFILEAKYGIEGYAAWFKLLELLCSTPGHCFWAASTEEKEFLTAKTGFTSTEKAQGFIDTLAAIGAIDTKLWENAEGIWSQNLVDNLSSMYNKRHSSVMPRKPVYDDINPKDANIISIKGGDNTQSKVKETKLKEKKEGDSFVSLDINSLDYYFKGDYKFLDDLRLEFKDLDFDGEIKKFNLYWLDGHRKLKRPRLALRNWLERARGFKVNKIIKIGRQMPTDEQRRREFSQ